MNVRKKEDPPSRERKGKDNPGESAVYKTGDTPYRYIRKGKDF